VTGNTIETGGTGRGGVMLAINEAAFHTTNITGEKKQCYGKIEVKERGRQSFRA